MKVFNVVKAIVRYKDKFLFLKKAKDPIQENIGKWECSGGRIQDKEDPKKAVLREVEEETGLQCKIIKKLAFLNMKTNEYDSRCGCFLLQANVDKVKLTEEHSDYKWIKAKKVKDINLVLFAGLLLEYFNNPEKYF